MQLGRGAWCLTHLFLSLTHNRLRAQTYLDCYIQTLLRILAECTCLDTTLSTADLGMKYDGTVTCPRDVRVAFVEQEPPMSGGTYKVCVCVRARSRGG
jgi:hypothetical protein